MKVAIGVYVFLALASHAKAQPFAEIRVDASTTSGLDGDICELRPDSGPCEAIFPRWFYNSDTQRCEEFNYGGCGGNANRFETRQQCENACDTEDICELSPDAGPCKAIFPRWFFNSDTNRCEQFVYGGCDGNSNRFETRLQCQNACRKDCIPVNCLINPCDVIKCPAFPGRSCIPNFCTDCDADFFDDHGFLVDCKISYCIPKDQECTIPENAIGFLTAQPVKRCCSGLSCCTCGDDPVDRITAVPVDGSNLPPVRPRPTTGLCQSPCICPIG